MVDTNKILTVSYGTFSCTLEGFDDSFGTMKAIAEYFRDLAADDRYFGAEPPTPDAEMLARIAEKEIARRVEARMEENSIVLRADRGSVLPVAAAAAAEAKPADLKAEIKAEPEADHAADPVAEDDLSLEESQPAETAAPQAPVKSTEDIVVPAALADVPAEDDHAEDDAEDDSVAAFDAMMANAPAQDHYEDEPGTISDDNAPQTFAAPAEPDINDEPVESVAAKLRRIRAVVSQGAEAGADPLFSEDEHADDFLADTNEELEAALAIDDEAELAAAPEDASDHGDVAALLDRFGADEPGEDDAPVDAPQEAAADDLSDVLVDQQPEEDEGDDAIFAPEDAIEDDVRADDSFDIDDIMSDDDISDDDFAEDIDMPEEAALDDAQQPGQIRARILKMKRAVFDAAVASGDLEEEADTQDDDLAADTGLSAEEEADLRNELAAVEAELATPEGDEPADLTAFEDDYEEVEGDDDLSDQLHGLMDDGDDDYVEVADLDDDHAGDDNDLAAYDEGDDDHDDNIFGSADDDGAEEDENDYAAEQAKPSEKPAFGADTEVEMGRIFAEADSQLDEETGKGRRSAIAHLRAAVAAAKAEEGAGGSLNSNAPDTDAYRDDLESVVRPRRPEAAKTRTRRPEVSRPAPLKLVAEQRVDVEDAGPQEPVRPRRVAMAAGGAAEAQAASGEFADYAESVGANSLPELLEAAAAYLSFVQGREQFSRPQLMTQVRQVEKDEFSREDGLRSFGQLLREGKIEKLEGGRFKASESISYRPDARYAGE